MICMAIERDGGKAKTVSRTAGYSGGDMASAICRLVESRAWAAKCAIMGILQCIPIVGWTVCAGHAGTWALDAIDGEDTDLPKVPFAYSARETLVLGLKSTLIALVRTIPAIALALAALVVGGTFDSGQWIGGIYLPFTNASWHYGTEDAMRETASYAMFALAAAYCVMAFPRHLAGVCRMADTGRLADGLDGRWAWRFARGRRGALACAATSLLICGIAGCAFAVLASAAGWALSMAGAPSAAIWALKAVLGASASGACYCAMACALRAYGSMLREWAPDDEDG